MPLLAWWEKYQSQPVTPQELADLNSTANGVLQVGGILGLKSTDNKAMGYWLKSTVTRWWVASAVPLTKPPAAS